MLDTENIPDRNDINWDILRLNLTIMRTERYVIDITVISLNRF